MARTSESYLYRIVRFDRLVQMLTQDKWSFSHPSEWEDPFERLVANDLTPMMFAQCWCRRGVSDAMWRIYSPDKLGVRIRTTTENLRSALQPGFDAQRHAFRISNVQYVNEAQYIARAQKMQEALARRQTFLRASAHLFLKRRAFEHEAETRIVLLDTSLQPDTKLKRVDVQINTRDLIDSVLVDPRAPDEFVDAYKHHLKDKLGFKGSVKKSQLYRSGERLEA